MDCSFSTPLALSLTDLPEQHVLKTNCLHLVIMHTSKKEKERNGRDDVFDKPSTPALKDQNQQWFKSDRARTCALKDQDHQ